MAPIHHPRDCSNYVQSPARTIIESLICICLIISYIPQYIRIVSYGTFGVSSWLILLTALFSSTQLATRFSNPSAKRAFDCVNEGGIRGFKAYSALLGFIQAIVQWACAMILVILYLIYRNDSPPLSYDHPLPSTGITTRPISSTKLKVIVITYTSLILPICLAILWRPDLVEDNFELDVWLTMLALGLHGLFVLPLFLLVPLQYVPQIITTLSLGTRGGISIVSLALQIVSFVILGVAQFLRVGTPQYGSPDQRHSLYDLYFQYLHISLNYIVTAVGQLVLLIVCLVVDWGHFSSGNVVGSVKQPRGEEEPLIFNSDN